MKKKHSSPEFAVIKHDQANAKFFVASFENGSGPNPTGAPSGAPEGTTNSQASSYGNDESGFNF